MIRTIRTTFYNGRKSAIAGALLLLAASLAAAQDRGPSTNPETLPQLDLSPAQKQTIFTSIANLNIRNESLPDFQPIAGAVVPTGVTLTDMPRSIVELVPQTRDFKVVMMSGRVVLVEPQSRRVVDAIAGEKS